MPYCEYISRNFKPETLELIEKIEEIIESFQAKGFVLTVRQCYYQCVGKNLIENNQKSYDRLGDIIANARLAGLMDWDAFEDRTRNYEQRSTWDSPAEVLRSAYRSYHTDWWAQQGTRPEVWVEKQALENVIESAANELDVGYFCCRGYASWSEIYTAGQRIMDRYGNSEHGQRTHIIYLGDHDPSGVDMVRDIEDRLKVIMGVKPRVTRVALNLDQVRLYELPPNPAKLSDGRSKAYIDRFGPESWELDAMDVTVLHQLIQAAIYETMDDRHAFDRAKRKEAEDRERLKEFARTFE